MNQTFVMEMCKGSWKFGGKLLRLLLLKNAESLPVCAF